jgi:hypothetical protein
MCLNYFVEAKEQAPRALRLATLSQLEGSLENAGR